MATPVAAAPGGAVDSRSSYWVIPIVRALVAAVAAIVVTFSSDHSASFGLLVFGVFAILSGIVTGGLHLGVLRDDRVARWSFALQGLVAALAGGAALAIAASQPSLPALVAIVTAWALITGALELYNGFRLRGRSPLAREWMTIGGLTVLLAIVLVTIPQSLDQHFTGPDGVERSLTASIVTVGIFGAYAAILAVLLTIGGLSLKWGTDRQATTTEHTA